MKQYDDEQAELETKMETMKTELAEEKVSSVDIMLMMVAMDQIHHLVSTMCEEEKLVKDMMRGSNLDSARSIKMKEKSILFRIHEAEERRLRLYEDYKAEILDEDEYSQLKMNTIRHRKRSVT